MYLTLDYWRLIEADESMVGGRGGRLVSYANVGRYLDNSSFVDLVANAWVGTTIEQSEVLAEIVREVLETGRTVTLAMKSDKRPPDPPTEATVWQSSVEDDQEPPLTVSWS